MIGEALELGGTGGELEVTGDLGRRRYVAISLSSMVGNVHFANSSSGALCQFAPVSSFAPVQNQTISAVLCKWLVNI